MNITLTSLNYTVYKRCKLSVQNPVCNIIMRSLMRSSFILWGLGGPIWLDSQYVAHHASMHHLILQIHINNLIIHAATVYILITWVDPYKEIICIHHAWKACVFTWYLIPHEYNDQYKCNAMQFYNGCQSRAHHRTVTYSGKCFNKYLVWYIHTPG